MSTALKLTNDICIQVSILDGSPFDDIKELINSSKFVADTTPQNETYIVTSKDCKWGSCRIDSETVLSESLKQPRGKPESVYEYFYGKNFELCRQLENPKSWKWNASYYTHTRQYNVIQKCHSKQNATSYQIVLFPKPDLLKEEATIFVKPIHSKAKLTRCSETRLFYRVWSIRILSLFS